MIKFFRNIRQNLLNEGKTAKYLKYAIGEIVLVVIGILIALSINNWNETKKEKVKEKKILVELESNLAINSKIIQSTIDRESRIRNEIGVLMDHLKMKKPFNDTIGFYLSESSFMEKIQFTNSSYESLKTIGLDIISNDSIRMEVTKLFSNRFPWFEMWVRDAGLSMTNALHTVNDQYFEAKSDDVYGKIPSDYEGALENKKLVNILSRRKAFKRSLIGQLEILLIEVEKAGARINKELETFD